MTGFPSRFPSDPNALVTSVNQGPVAGFRNAVINGGMSVAQRGTSFTGASTPANSDDTYLLDRWTLLSDGNDIVDVTREATVVPTGGLYSCALDVETAGKKFGIVQFIEQKNCIGLIGNRVTLSFKARKGASNATVTTMRAAILAWSSTADSVTSDVVSAWGASGTNPTLATNWTAENTAADLTLTDSFQTFSVSADIDTASAKNIAVFLYYNNADGTVSDFIYVTDVQLERGSEATPFERRTDVVEELLCKRYFSKSYNRGQAPGAVSSTGAVYFRASAGDQTDRVQVRIPVEARATPTITLYSTAGTAANMRDETAAGDKTAATTSVGHNGFLAYPTENLTSAASMAFHWTAASEL